MFLQAETLLFTHHTGPHKGGNTAIPILTSLVKKSAVIRLNQQGAVETQKINRADSFYPAGGAAGQQYI